MPRRRSSREGRGAAEGPEGGDAPHETHESRLIHTDTFHTYTPILPYTHTRHGWTDRHGWRTHTHTHRHDTLHSIHTHQYSQQIRHGWTRPRCRDIFSTSFDVHSPVVNTRKRPSSAHPVTTPTHPAAPASPARSTATTSSHDDSTTGRRRRDERSEPGVEGGETVHERWFIRHGRHVRDSAVGQCVIRRDESGLIARFDSNSMHSFIRGWSWVVVGARDASRTRVERRVDRSGRRDRRHARRMDESKDESRRMKDEKRNETRERERKRERD